MILILGSTPYLTPTLTLIVGPSFEVDGRVVKWQGWEFRVGFNYREGLVLHDVEFNGKSVMRRGSLVEMAVPYADPHPPFQRKCAFDVGDYGQSLRLTTTLPQRTDTPMPARSGLLRQLAGARL